MHPILLGRTPLAVVPAVLLGVVAGTGEPGVQAVDVVALVLLGLWALVVWWMFATRAGGALTR